MAPNDTWPAKTTLFAGRPTKAPTLIPRKWPQAIFANEKNPRVLTPWGS